MILEIKEVTSNRNKECLYMYTISCNNEELDLTIVTSRTSVSVMSNDVIIQKAEFNGLPIILGKKDKKGCYKVYSVDDHEIGKVDELSDLKNKFAVSLNELIYVCKKCSGDVFLISSIFGVSAYIKRFDDGSNYKCYSDGSISNIDLSMIIILAERKWFMNEDFECLSCEGLSDEAERIKFPMFSELKMSKLYNKELSELTC